MSPPHDILNLPHVRAVGVAQHETHHVVSAVGGVEPMACARCGSEALHRHGTARHEAAVLHGHADARQARGTELRTQALALHGLRQDAAELAAVDGPQAADDQPTRKTAEAEARAWLGRLDPMIATAFRETAGALNRGWDEVFDICDHPVTNACTESVDRLAKGLNRMGRGCSFGVIRARLLFDREARKPTSAVVRTKVRKQVPAARPRGGRMIDLACGFEQPKMLTRGSGYPRKAGAAELRLGRQRQRRAPGDGIPEDGGDRQTGLGRGRGQGGEGAGDTGAAGTRRGDRGRQHAGRVRQVHRRPPSSDAGSR